MGTMDLSEKESLPQTNENKKCCADCRTTRTPLWRGGPAGPKSLCNACGIRYRKKMVSVVGLRKRTERKRERTHTHASSSTAPTNTTNDTSSPTANTKNDTNGDRERGLSQGLKVRLMALGKEVFSHRSSSSVVKKQRYRRRRKLGEEEQAAVLLMALSCGSVFA